MKRLPLVFLLLALPATAAELCRFRALGAENPFQRWLGSQEVTCVSDATPVVFPPGLWNVFARGEGVVSAAPLLVDGAAPAPVTPALGPAATVTPLLPSGLTGMLYAPRRGSAFPVDGARVSVPADEPLWLFVLDKSVPLAVLSIPPLPPGTERQVDARSGGPAAVIGWLQMPEADRAALRTASGVSSPAVHAGSHDADLLPPPELLHGAFFRIRDVEPGNAEVRVEGRGWVPDRRVMKVQPGVTVAAAPLLVRAAATLVVHWNADRGLPELDRSIGSCQEPNDAPQLILTIAKCTAPPRRGQRSEPADCSTIREEKVRDFFGSLTFDNVAPGYYRAEIRYGKLPPVSASGSVAALRVGDLRLFPDYFTVYGSVTRGGEPLGEKVSIKFRDGIGFAPAETEEYRAAFLPPPIEDEAQITVAACDGSPQAVVLTDRPMRPRARFDIDIPANELAVQVSDTFTREPLPGAVVKLESMAVLRPPRVVYSTKGSADEEGKVVWTGLPVRETHLTVTHAGYEKRIVEPFSMEKRGTKTIDVQLLPLRGTRGRIVSDRPFDSAAVFWFSPAGLETERAELSADGTFVYASSHMPEETMAVVSASHPLWVLHAPATGRRESITLRFPSAPAVAFELRLAASVPPGETRYIGLIIGGVRVPQPALTEHQTLHRDPTLLRGTGPLNFHQLLATGAIDVLYGPAPEEVASRARAMDFFALPKFAEAPRQRLQPGASSVVFAVRPGGRIVP